MIRKVFMSTDGGELILVGGRLKPVQNRIRNRFSEETESSLRSLQTNWLDSRCNWLNVKMFIVGSSFNICWNIMIIFSRFQAQHNELSIPRNFCSVDLEIQDLIQLPCLFKWHQAKYFILIPQRVSMLSTKAAATAATFPGFLVFILKTHEYQWLCFRIISGTAWASSPLSLPILTAMS